MSANEVLTALLVIITMTVIVAVRYLVTSGGFAWLSAIKNPGQLSGLQKQIRHEVTWSLASAVVYGVPAGVVAWGWQRHGWTQIYDTADAYPYWWVPLSFLLCLLLHDAWFYWAHRLMHRPSMFSRMHAVHHASRPPTAWAAMSFHPWEALSGALVIPLLTFVIPLHVYTLLSVLMVMTFMGVTNHMGWEIFPKAVVQGRLGRWLITATHHQLHHERYTCNYGLYFRFWDRLCNTDRGLGVFDHHRGKG